MSFASHPANSPFDNHDLAAQSSRADEGDHERFWTHHEIDQLRKDANGSSAADSLLENPS